MTEHQARANNMADVSAKDGSQETGVALAGMLAGMLLTGVESPPLIWTLFVIMTAGHLLSNYLAVSAVVLATFNPQRLHLVLDSWKRGRQLLTPQQVSTRERILSPLTILGPLASPVRFGVPFDQLQLAHGQATAILRSQPPPPYLIAPLSGSPSVVAIAVSESLTSPQEQLCAYISAYLAVSHDEASQLLASLISVGWTDHQHKLGLSEWRFHIGSS